MTKNAEENVFEMKAQNTLFAFTYYNKQKHPTVHMTTELRTLTAMTLSFPL